ncbi:cysteine desulfurase [Umbelopsis nana]
MLSRHLQRNIWKAVPSLRPTIFKQAPKAGPYALRSFSGSAVKHNASTVETLSPTGATSPMDPRVLDAMLPYMTDLYGNPHSRTHQYGWESEKAVEHAREHPSRSRKTVGADPKEVIFTSGATESNNLSIKGVAHFYKGKKKRIITTQIEHKCVLESCCVLQEEGFDVTYLPVQPNGLIDIKQLEEAIRPDTAIANKNRHKSSYFVKLILTYLEFDFI